MFSFLLTIVIFTATTAVVHFFWSNRRLLAVASRIPGPVTFAPLIGGLFQFCGKSDSEIASTLLQFADRYTSPIRFWFGPLLMVMVDRPEDLKIVLNSDRCLDKVDPYQFFHVDRGLFASTAKLWKSHRKVLMPSFGPKAIDGFLPIFTEKCRLLSGEMEQFLDIGTVDVHYLVEKYTLNVICETIADTLKYFGGNFPSPVCIHMGPLPHIAIFDPEQLQAVLYSQNCLDKSMHYSFLRVPRTLISAHGHLWKGLRKALNPAFGPGILNSFIPIFNQKSALMTELIQQHVGKPERNFERDISKCTLDQIYLTAYGCDYRMQQSPEGDLSVKLFDIYMKLIAVRMFTVWKYPEFIYRMTKGYRVEQESLETYHKINMKIARSMNFDEQLIKSDEQNLSNEDTGTKKPKNYLKCLMKYICEDNPSAKDDLLQHIGIILFAGNDTTAKTISFILMLIAMHPDVQQRCFQEIMQVCPGKDQFVTAEDIANLPYLDMVCKETMRLYPVVPIMARVTTGDVKLNDQHTIPANCNIIIGVYQIHRDPKIWGPNAEIFDPDNFLPDNVAKRHPYSFIPFSGGPRNCIGMRYAWLSMKVIIIHMLRAYRLKTSLTIDQLKISYGVMLNLANGCQLSIENR